MSKSNVNQLFTTIKSKNEKFVIKVGKLTNLKFNIFLNFNPHAYPHFIDAIENLSYLMLERVSDYDGESGGLAIKLEKKDVLSEFIEEITEILYRNVENIEPINTTHKGTKNNENKESNIN